MHISERKTHRMARTVPWCTLCGREIAPGERGWYRNGTSVCEDCFERYAQREFAPYAVIFGEEGEHDAL